MTQQFMEPWAPEFVGNSWYVSKNGSDVSASGRGSMDKPYLTIQNAITNASAGDRIYVGHGSYAEVLTINKSLYISAMVPESVTVTSATAAGATVTYNGTQTGGVWDGINVINTDNAAWTSIGINVNAIAGNMSGKYVFTKCKVTAGTGGATLASAYVIAGNNTSPINVEIDSPRLIGGQQLALGTSDVVLFRDCLWSDGPQDWFGITAGGQVYLRGCVLLGAGGTERINFGGATATSAILNLESSHINGTVYLNNLAGTGYVVMRDAAVYAITNNQEDQIVQYYDGDYLTIQMQNIDANPGAAANHTMYTVPTGRDYFPERVTTSNKVQATGGAFNYQYNGSAPGTIVAAPGGGIFALGTTVNVCLADVLPATGTVVFRVVAPSTQGGDYVDATVRGRLV